MKSLIITDTHNNRGEVVDLFFTDRAYTYADDEGNCYHLSDFIEVEALDHEEIKADKMIEYWALVQVTIVEFKKKKAANMDLIFHLPEFKPTLSVSGARIHAKRNEASHD